MNWMEYLTTSEVAAYLRVKERTVYDLVARKAIPCSRVTGKLIFPRRLIDRWLDANVHLVESAVLSPPPIFGGSSDPLLEWALRESHCGLATLFEGSSAGLKRFAEAQAFAVGVHLRNPEDDDFNIAAVRSLAGVHDVLLIEWAEREQGLVVARGNPLNLRQLRDVVDKHARFVVRQEGAGGHLLFNVLLAGEQVDSSGLLHSERPALTEADVASAVADGEADCGLAVGSVARRFGLDFVPLQRERFDVACRRRDYFEPPLQKLFEFTRTQAFAEKARQLGHYGVECTGTVRFNA
ncbi:helix-turn-helix transcriptional regulator [Mesorhizobium sp. WSM2239]|uniref:Helix-turn-helix transcriptional regulator n=2 Tax=unclassified Mesorhizobium TaxID=325217 RepID=A0AAU8DFI8_9HYPH